MNENDKNDLQTQNDKTYTVYIILLEFLINIKLLLMHFHKLKLSLLFSKPKIQYIKILWKHKKQYKRSH